MNNPFELHTSSVFVVGSPFQALCANAAIKNLEIGKYTIIAILYGGKRDGQLLCYLNKSGLDYCLFHYSKINLLKSIYKSILLTHGYYERLFIGNFNAYHMLSIGLPYVKPESPIVNLDDGNVVVSLLSNTFKGWDSKRNQFIFGLLARKRKCEVLRNFYTVYFDIKNPIYRTQHNNLSSVWSIYNGSREKKHVFIIGTNITSYCKQLDVTPAIFVEKLYSLFDNIKQSYIEEEVIYVPHGADPSDYAQSLCHLFGFKFQTVDTMVEDCIFKSSIEPRALYGFCSTSLLNIKREMPQVEVNNVFIFSPKDNPYKGKYRSIVEYYKKYDIPCIEYEV